MVRLTKAQERALIYAAKAYDGGAHGAGCDPDGKGVIRVATVQVLAKHGLVTLGHKTTLVDKHYAWGARTVYNATSFGEVTYELAPAGARLAVELTGGNVAGWAADMAAAHDV